MSYKPGLWVQMQKVTLYKGIKASAKCVNIKATNLNFNIMEP